MRSRDGRILTLLFASAFLVYIDRANLSVGATDIMRDLHLSPYRIGILLSAFFWTYALCQLFGIAGWVADRFNVCWVLAGGFALWSAATAFTGMAEIMVISSASKRRVKPLSGRAHGTLTVLMPHASQRTRGTRALR